MTAKVRMLLSYWPYRHADLDELLGARFTPEQTDVFADSGGFSAYTQGVSISIGEYLDWLDRWSHWISIYANLDVIKDPAATSINQQEMEAEGYQPVPVFHGGSPWRYLDTLLEAGYPYIALGGIARFHKNDYMPWLVDCFRRAAGTSTVYHAFGVTGFPVARSFPWYSLDSMSWTMAFRRRFCYLFDPWKPGMRTILAYQPEQVRKHIQLFRWYGIDATVLLAGGRIGEGEGDVGRTMLARLGTESYRRLEVFLQEKYGPIQNLARPDDPGPKVYLVGDLREAGSYEDIIGGP